eukprot:2685333-Rhodomonas_salina.2
MVLPGPGEDPGTLCYIPTRVLRDAGTDIRSGTAGARYAVCYNASVTTRPQRDFCAAREPRDATIATRALLY